MWVLGDDDQLISGALEYILNILHEYNSEKLGIISLNSYSYLSKEISPPFYFKSTKVFDSSDFIKKFFLKLTFISSLILRKDRDFQAKKFVSSQLVQWKLVINNLNTLNKHLFINKYCILSKQNNSGEFAEQFLHEQKNYDRVKIFLINFIEILKTYKNQKACSNMLSLSCS